MGPADKQKQMISRSYVSFRKSAEVICVNDRYISPYISELELLAIIAFDFNRLRYIDPEDQFCFCFSNSVFSVIPIVLTETIFAMSNSTGELALSLARWYSANTHLFSLGILGTEPDYFPKWQPLLSNSNLNRS